MVVATIKSGDGTVGGDAADREGGTVLLQAASPAAGGVANGVRADDVR